MPGSLRRTSPLPFFQARSSRLYHEMLQAPATAPAWLPVGTNRSVRSTLSSGSNRCCHASPACSMSCHPQPKPQALNRPERQASAFPITLSSYLPRRRSSRLPLACLRSVRGCGNPGTELPGCRSPALPLGREGSRRRCAADDALSSRVFRISRRCGAPAPCTPPWSSSKASNGRRLPAPAHARRSLFVNHASGHHCADAARKRIYDALQGLRVRAVRVVPEL